MKVLIIGGTKFIGKHIAEECNKNHYQVFFLNRGITEKTSNTIICNIDEIISKKEVILKHNFDVVFNCLCNTEKNAQDIVEIFKHTHTKLIILSSMDCYHAFQELIRGKNNSDYPIDEKDALTEIKHYYSHLSSIKNKDYDKNLMSEVFISAFKNKLVNVTIFRLPMVYGTYDYQFAHRHGEIIKRILDKKPDYIISYGKYHSIWTFGYVKNLVQAMIFSINKDITNGKIYNLNENKVRSWKNWCDLYAEIAGFKFNYKILPDEIIEEKNTLVNADPIHVISSANLFANETGYQEQISLKQGMKETFDFAIANPDFLPNIDYEKEALLLEKYQKLLNTFL